MKDIQSDFLSHTDAGASGPLESYLAASVETLQALMLSRMSTAANLKKDIATLIAEVVEQMAEAKFAEILIAQKQNRRRSK